MAIFTFHTFPQSKDQTLFLSIYTVISGFLISTGLTMIVYSEQIIDNSKSQRKMLKEINAFIRGKKIRSSDLIPLRNILNQMTTVEEKLNKNKITETEAIKIYKQQTTALKNILEEYTE